MRHRTTWFDRHRRSVPPLIWVSVVTDCTDLVAGRHQGRELRCVEVSPLPSPVWLVQELEMQSKEATLHAGLTPSAKHDRLYPLAVDASDDYGRGSDKARARKGYSSTRLATPRAGACWRC
jgi:hypothetical protein